MKFNNEGSVLKEDFINKRKLLSHIGKGYSVQASRYQGTTEFEHPLGNTRASQSLIFDPSKLKCGNQLPSINEKQDMCNRFRQIGARLSQVASNDDFVQPSTKKRKLDVLYHSVSGGILSARHHQSKLEAERQTKLTGGKALQHLSVSPIFKGIKKEYLPKNQAREEYLPKAVTTNKSKTSKFGKLNDKSELHDQQAGEQTLESSAAENSCSSVSSSESFTARDCTSVDKCSHSRPYSDTNKCKLEAYPFFTNGKDKMIISEDKQANEVHKLESLAYRSVLNALRARGSLDWHRELLLTDLRLSLHITNDEHRLELTHMCLAQNV